MNTNLKFILNPTSIGDKRPIILKCNSTVFSNNYFMYSTGLMINKSLWSDKRKDNIPGYAIGDSSEAISINKKLKEFNDTFIELVNSGIVDKEELKKELNKNKPGYKEPQKDDDKKTIDGIIEFAENTLNNRPIYYSRTDKAWKEMSPGTVISKKQSIEKLKEFEKAYGYKVTFENCDREFWEQFSKFLLDKKFSQGTRGRIVKDIRSFLNSASKKKKKVCKDYREEGVAPVESSEKKSMIYLKEEEVIKIAELDLSDRPAMENSRDWLILACGTGLRSSDLLRLDESHLIDDDFGKSIRIKTQKTGVIVHIPIIFDWLKNMFHRRNWKFPDKISSQKLNQNFKDIGRLAKLERQVTGRIKPKNEKFSVLKEIPIAEVLSTHVGRRTFVSVLVNKTFKNKYGEKDRLSLINISKMTGHSRIDTLRIYEQLDERENAREVAIAVNGANMEVS